MRCYWLLVAALLSACTTGEQDPRAVLTRAQLDQVTEPLLFAEFKDSGLAATLTRTNQNSSFATWQTGDGVSLTFRGPFIVGTRGIGDDLMSADVSEAVSGASSGFYKKFYTHLDGEHQTVFNTFQCQISGQNPENVTIFGRVHLVTRVDESCFSVDGQVVNTFWSGIDGTIWRAKQWVSPSSGYLLTERLVR